MRWPPGCWTAEAVHGRLLRIAASGAVGEQCTRHLIWAMSEATAAADAHDSFDRQR